MLGVNFAEQFFIYSIFVLYIFKITLTFLQICQNNTDGYFSL